MTRVEFAVIVPFYQERAGILCRAVSSALRQNGGPAPLVVVVDDGSPIDAEAELAELCARYPGHITVLKQRNSGPGAARNAGLEYVVGKAEAVAFLDSDDVWEAEHLNVARGALARGFDFYFCDAVHRESKASIFETKASLEAESVALPSSAEMYEYRGDFFQLILDNCPLQISATVFRPSRLPVRFQEELRTAGEDYLFWLEVAAAGARVAFSTCKNVRLGRGVNIFAGVQWGTDAALKQTYYQQLFISKLVQQFKLTPQQRATCAKLGRAYRQKTIENVCSMLAQGRRFDPVVLYRHVALDPLLLAALPSYIAKRAAGAILQLFKQG